MEKYIEVEFRIGTTSVWRRILEDELERRCARKTDDLCSITGQPCKPNESLARTAYISLIPHQNPSERQVVTRIFNCRPSQDSIVLEPASNLIGNCFHRNDDGECSLSEIPNKRCYPRLNCGATLV